MKGVSALRKPLHRLKGEGIAHATACLLGAPRARKVSKSASAASTCLPTAKAGGPPRAEPRRPRVRSLFAVATTSVTDGQSFKFETHP